MHALTCLGLGSLLAALTAARADEPAKSEYQAAPFEKLSPKGGQFNWGEEAFLTSINKQGGDGWEALLTSDVAFLFRKPNDGPKWEYKSVKVKNSPFSVLGMKDEDAYTIILDRMGSDGFVPCAVNGVGEYTLFKRAKDLKPGKLEFQLVMLADVVKAKTAPAERWREKEFVDALNKYGGEGWDWCVGNVNAVVFRRSPVKWEYKLVRVTKSPLSRNFEPGDKDDEAAAFKLILEGLEAKGWTPCGCGYLDREILVKRELKKDTKE